MHWLLHISLFFIQLINITQSLKDEPCQPIETTLLRHCFYNGSHWLLQAGYWYRNGSAWLDEQGQKWTWDQQINTVDISNETVITVNENNTIMWVIDNSIYVLANNAILYTNSTLRCRNETIEDAKRGSRDKRSGPGPSRDAIVSTRTSTTPTNVKRVNVRQRMTTTITTAIIPPYMPTESETTSFLISTPSLQSLTVSENVNKVEDGTPLSVTTNSTTAITPLLTKIPTETTSFSIPTPTQQSLIVSENTSKIEDGTQLSDKMNLIPIRKTLSSIYRIISANSSSKALDNTSLPMQLTTLTSPNSSLITKSIAINSDLYEDALTTTSTSINANLKIDDKDYRALKLFWTAITEVWKRKFA